MTMTKKFKITLVIKISWGRDVPVEFQVARHAKSRQRELFSNENWGLFLRWVRETEELVGAKGKIHNLEVSGRRCPVFSRKCILVYTSEEKANIPTPPEFCKESNEGAVYTAQFQEEI